MLSAKISKRVDAVLQTAENKRAGCLNDLRLLQTVYGCPMDGYEIPEVVIDDTAEINRMIDFSYKEAERLKGKADGQLQSY